MDPRAQVCITNLSPNLMSYLLTFITSSSATSKRTAKLIRIQFNPGFPHNSASDNREAGGSEYGSWNMDQDSNIGGSPKVKASEDVAKFEDHNPIHAS